MDSGDPPIRAARRLQDVPEAVRAALASGAAETANWTEWMATDMAALARVVAGASSHRKLKTALLAAADEAAGRRILARLSILGRAISSAVESFEDPAFALICTHTSDVVRQWGAYAVNDDARPLTLEQRLCLTLRFAGDRHMSVRECAWMAFRPHLSARLEQGLQLLEGVSRCENANLRRFAIEVSRPRSVWGQHIPALKCDPGKGMALLQNVYQDTSRYVRLSAGNWLNDASKTQPDWVRDLCGRWTKSGNKYTAAIVSRAMRTISRLERITMQGHIDQRGQNALTTGGS